MIQAAPTNSALLTLLLLGCALVFVFWMAGPRMERNQTMIQLTATSNDIEQALRELYELAANGPLDDPDTRRALNLILSFSHNHGFNVCDFAFMTQRHLKQGLQLMTFLFSTNGDIEKYIAKEELATLANRWEETRATALAS